MAGAEPIQLPDSPDSNKSILRLPKPNLTLSLKQRQAVSLAATGLPWTLVEQQVGVNFKTLDKWRKQSFFMREVELQRISYLEQASKTARADFDCLEALAVAYISDELNPQKILERASHSNRGLKSALAVLTAKHYFTKKPEVQQVKVKTKVSFGKFQTISDELDSPELSDLEQEGEGGVENGNTGRSAK